LKKLFRYYLIRTLFYTMDLFLLSGQSNMCGRGRAEPHESGNGEESSIFALDVECNWDEARGGVYTYQNFPDHNIFDFQNKVGLGPGLRFAEYLREAGCKRNIGLIPTAVGGTRIKQWHPEKGKCYKKAIARALEAKKHGTLRALLWHQGESDSNEEDYVSYSEKLRAVFNGFRRDLQEPNLIILVGTLGDWLDGHFAAKTMFSRWRDINKQIREIALSTTNVHLVASEGLDHSGDNLHFSADGARKLGERYCDVYLSITGNADKTDKSDPVQKQTTVQKEVMLGKHGHRITKVNSVIAEIRCTLADIRETLQVITNARQMLG